MPRDTPAPDPEAVAALTRILHDAGIGCAYGAAWFTCGPTDQRMPRPWHESQARIILTAIAADPAARRAVVAELLTVEELAEALHGAYCDRWCELAHNRMYHVDPDIFRDDAARILAVLRDKPEGAAE